MKRAMLEVACFGLQSALIAQNAGADRIELCENYEAGGITPSETLISRVRQQVRLPIHVMIRPRPGNFVYSDAELSEMRQSILFCQQQNIEGVVFGVLTPNHEVDAVICQQLTTLANPMKVTFHRAIDSCPDIAIGIQSLIDLGIHYVLSSGGADTALAGIDRLTALQQQFGRQINIMPGGGLRSTNLSAILTTGCGEYHTAAITSGLRADATEIKAMKELLLDSVK